MKKKEVLLFILVMAIAVFFRFYLIGKLPGGLFPDEAANGLDINNIFKGHLQPFYPRGNGREALFFYLEALSVSIWGRGFWQHDIVSAAIGFFSVLGCYLLTKRLYGYKTALLASFLMAVSTWHIVLSRTAFRAVQIPLFTSFTLYFIVRFFQAESPREKKWMAVWSGIFFAGGFYTYIAYRIMPVVLLVIAFFLFLADRKQGFAWWKALKGYLAYAIAAAVIVFLPLGIYFVHNPSAFVGRSGQVSVFNKDLNHGHLAATIADVAFKSIRAYFIDGDVNWRSNVSGDPFLSPFVSPFFGAGLVVLTLLTLRFFWQSRKNQQNLADLPHVITITLFWGMLIPVISTAEGIPHGLRSIGTIPAVFMISAVAMVYFAKMVLKLWHYKWMEYVYALVVVLYLGSIGYLAFTEYFVYTYNNTENAYAFRSDLSTVSDYINQTHPNRIHTYLVLDLFSLQTVDYLTTNDQNPAWNNPYIVVDPANSDKLHPQVGDTLIFTQSTLPDYERFVGHHQVQILANPRSRLGEVDMVSVRYLGPQKSQSLGTNADDSFIGINFGNRVDWSWDNIQFDPWKIVIWQCQDPKCVKTTQLKDNDQNDYLSTHDWLEMDGTKSDLYFKAQAFTPQGNLLKDFGIIKLPKYQN